MLYAVLLAYAIIFIELFIGLKIIHDAYDVLQLSSKSIGVMKSSSMTDREKEIFMRTNSLSMLLTTFNFIGKFFFIFVTLFLINLAVEFFSADLALKVTESFTSIKFITLVTIVAIFYVWIRDVVRKKL